MSQPHTTSRAARDRRLVAVFIWFALVAVAIVLWNTRTQGKEITNPSEPVAFLLAAFTTFVSLFAWMLYNPARGISAETPTLMLAGIATLFPPCVIAFCTMPPGSPLSGWLTAGLFVLLAIAVMSPVPDEFFAIPRDRGSYLLSFVTVEVPEQEVLSPEPEWLRSTNLTEAVTTSTLPSLAPRTWREGDSPSSRPRRRTRRNRGDTTTDDSPTDSTRRPGLFERFAQRRPGRSTPPSDQKRSNRSDSGTGTIPVPVADTTSPPQSDAKPSDRRERTQQPPKRQSEDTKRTIDQRLTDDSATREKRSKSHTSDERSSIPLAAAPTDIQMAGVDNPESFDRIKDDVGGEMIEGTVRIHFARGQRRANMHVPFSPPLDGAPDVECTAIDHDGVRVKAAERRAWGIRIEGRRSDTARVEDVEVAFSAVYSS